MKLPSIRVYTPETGISTNTLRPQNPRAKCEDCVHHKARVERHNAPTEDLCLRVMRACSWERKDDVFGRGHPLPNCGPEGRFYKAKP